jgi:phage terminase large subunit
MARRQRETSKDVGLGRQSSARVKNKVAKQNKGLQRLKKLAAAKRKRLEAEQRKREKEEEERLRKEQEELDSVYKRLEKYKEYRGEPVRFAEEILGIKLWSAQKEILEELETPPYRVFCAASHGVGKSFVAAVALIYMSVCYPDSISFWTAPTQNQVENILGKLFRGMHPEKWMLVGDVRPEFRVNNEWYGMGRAGSSGDSIQGLHPKSGNGLLVCDEAVGIDDEILEALHGISGSRIRQLYICNPTDVNSPAYTQEWLSGRYKQLHISSFDHPNIKAYLEGEEIPIPGAIEYDHLLSLLEKWSTKVPAEFVQEGDIEFPPESGNWYRPDARAQSRLMGIWPTEEGTSFFSEALVKRFLKETFDNPGLHEQRYEAKADFDEEICVGLDIARLGNDSSVLTVRIKNEIKHIYDLGKHDLTGLYTLFTDTLDDIAHMYDIEDVLDIPIILDSTGLGSGLSDLLENKGYAVTPVNFSQKAYEPETYSNARSEMYGLLAENIKDNNIVVEKEVAEDYGIEIRDQMLTAGVYKYDAKGRYLLLPKDRLSQSPDILDSISLACYEAEPRFFTISVER